MRIMQPELMIEISKYLNQTDCLTLSTCAQNSSAYSCDNYIRINAKHRFKSAKMLLPFVNVGDENPLFGIQEDLEEFMNELYEKTSEQKIKMILENLSYYANDIFIRMKFPSFEQLFWNTSLCKRFKKKKHVFSPKPWNYCVDTSVIVHNIYISGIYGVKVPSRQHRIIRASSTLKALVG